MTRAHVEKTLPCNPSYQNFTVIKIGINKQNFKRYPRWNRIHENTVVSVCVQLPYRSAGSSSLRILKMFSTSSPQRATMAAKWRFPSSNSPPLSSSSSPLKAEETSNYPLVPLFIVLKHVNIFFQIT